MTKSLVGMILKFTLFLGVPFILSQTYLLHLNNESFEAINLKREGHILNLTLLWDEVLMVSLVQGHVYS